MEKLTGIEETKEKAAAKLEVWNVDCHNNKSRLFNARPYWTFTQVGDKLICDDCLTCCYNEEDNTLLPTFKKRRDFECQCGTDGHVKRFEKVRNSEEEGVSKNCLVEMYFERFSGVKRCPCLATTHIYDEMKKYNTWYKRLEEFININKAPLSQRRETLPASIYEKMDLFQMIYFLYEEKGELHKAFFSNLLKEMKELRQSVREESNKSEVNPDRITKHRSINFTEGIKWFNSLVKTLFKRNSFNYEIEELNSIFHIDFLIDLFNPHLKMWEMMVEINYYALSIYRKLIINSRSHLNYLKPLFNEITNVTPIHRKLFRMKIEEFFVLFGENAESGKDKYMTLLEYVYRNLKHLMFQKNKTDLTKTNQKFLFDEYVHLSEYLFFYNHTNPDILIEQINKIEELYNLEPSYSIKEKTIQSFIVAMNDMNFNEMIAKKRLDSPNFVFIGDSSNYQLKLLNIAFSESMEKLNEEEIDRFIETKGKYKDLKPIMLQLNKKLNIYNGEDDYYINSLDNLKEDDYFFEYLNEHTFKLSKENKEREQRMKDIFHEVLRNYFFASNKMMNVTNQINEFETALIDIKSESILHLLNEVISSEDNKEKNQILIFPTIFQILMNFNKLLNDQPSLYYREVKLKQDDDSSHGELYEKLTEKITEITCTLLDKVVESNRFLISLLFNERIFTNLFRPYLEKSIISATFLKYFEYFRKWLDVLRGGKWRINLEVLCNRYYDFKLNLPEESYEAGLTFFKSCLTVANEESKDKCAEFIFGALKTVEAGGQYQTDLLFILADLICELPNAYFFQLVSKYIKIAPPFYDMLYRYFTIENADRGSGKVPQTMLTKGQGKDVQHLLSEHLIKNNFFKYDKFLYYIEKSLDNVDLDLHKRIRFFELYCRCLIESPYHMDDFVKKENDNKEKFTQDKILNYPINRNFITEKEFTKPDIKGNFKYFNIDEKFYDFLVNEYKAIFYCDEGVVNQKNVKENDYYMLFNSEGKAGIIVVTPRNEEFSKLIKGKVPQDKWPEPQKKEFKDLCERFIMNYNDIILDSFSIKMICNFDKAIDHMKRFPIYVNQWYNQNSGLKKKDFKLLFKMFKMVILNPSRNILHKVLCYNDKVTNRIKYYIYTVSLILANAVVTLVDLLNYPSVVNRFDDDLMNKLFFRHTKAGNENQQKWGEFLKDLKDIATSFLGKNKNFVEAKEIIKEFQVILKRFNIKHHQDRLYLEKNVKKERKFRKRVVDDIDADDEQANLLDKIEKEMRVDELVKTIDSFRTEYRRIKEEKRESSTLLIEKVLLNQEKYNYLNQRIVKQVIYLLYYYRSFSGYFAEEIEDDLQLLAPDSSSLLSTFTHIMEINPKVFQNGIINWITEEESNLKLKELNKKFQDYKKEKAESEITIKETKDREEKSKLQSRVKSLSDELEKMEKPRTVPTLMKIINYNLTKRIPTFTDFIFLEYYTMSPDASNGIIVFYMRIFKLMTLLCQDYNPHFPNIVSYFKVSEDMNLTQYVYTLMTSLLLDLANDTKGESFMKFIFTKEGFTKNHYYKNFFELFFSLLNEYVQARVQPALQFGSEEFLTLYKRSSELIKTVSSNSFFDDYLYFYFRFLQTATFEFGKITPQEINIKDILQVLFSLYQKLFSKFVIEGNCKVDDYDSYKQFLKAILDKSENFQDYSFQMFTRFFIYINNKASIDREGPCAKLLQAMEYISTKKYDFFFSEKTTKNEQKANQYFILQREIYLVFSHLVKRVEINTSYEFFAQDVGDQFKLFENLGEISDGSKQEEGVVKGGDKKINIAYVELTEKILISKKVEEVKKPVVEEKKTVKVETKVEEKPEDDPFADDKPEDDPFADDKPEDDPFADDKPEDDPFAEDKPEDDPFAEDKKEDKPEDDPFAEEKPEDDPFADDKPEDDPFAEDKPEDDPFAEEKPEDDPFAEEKPEDDPFADDKPEEKKEEDKPEDDPFADDKPEDDPFADDKPEDDPFAEEKPEDDPFADEKPEDDPFAEEKPEDDSFADEGDKKDDNPEDDPFAEEKPEDDPFAEQPADKTDKKVIVDNLQEVNTTPTKVSPLKFNAIEDQAKSLQPSKFHKPEDQNKFPEVKLPSGENTSSKKGDSVQEEEEEDDSSKKKTKTKEIFFVVHPDSKYIEKEDLKAFLKQVKYEENYTVKLDSLLQFYFYMEGQVVKRKEMQNIQKSKWNYILKPHFKHAENFSIIMSILTNILLIFSIYSEKTTTGGYTVVYPYYWLIYSVSFVHLLALGWYIGVRHWSKVKKLLSRREEEENKCKEEKKEIVNFLNNDSAVIYVNFFLGLFAIMTWRLNFLYSLQLFCLFNVFPTMKVALVSVKEKYTSFLAAGFIIVIFLLFFSIFGVVFYQDEFYNADLQENICDSLLHCFLSLLYYGVRTGSGLGFGMKPISDASFWDDFIVEWLFYFFIMLVMLNIINGIIVDTFQDLREKNSQQKEFSDNSCFVCSIHRSRFEACGLDYEHHIRNEHSIHEYLDYIYRINNTENKDEFSSCEYEIYEKIRQTRTDFFPVKNALSLERAEQRKN